MFNPGKRNVPRFLTEAWMDCGRRLWLIAPKTCPICWVSHMFSIWKHRYSYGICFGSVCALQNSTPNISTPNILSFCFLSTPEELKKCIFYVGAHDYIILYIYIYWSIELMHKNTFKAGVHPFLQWPLLPKCWKTWNSRSLAVRKSGELWGKLIDEATECTNRGRKW